MTSIAESDRTAPSDNQPSLAIVVPMYNEIAGAERCIRRIGEIMPTLGIPVTLIVVNDGSTDGTGEAIDGLRNEGLPFVVVHQDNRGYGGALVRGGQEATTLGLTYCLFIDSDLTNPPEHIARFVPAMREGFDVIKGNRFGAGGTMAEVPMNRRVYSVGGNIVARLLFRVGLDDCTNGFRAIRTGLFVKMPLKQRGFSVIVEELYWAKRWGLSMTSVPTTLSSRASDLRPTMFAYKPSVLWSYLKFALLAAVMPSSRPPV